MSVHPDNPHPVDSNVMMGAGIPDADLDRLIAATMPSGGDDCDPMADIPFPAGAIWVGDWRRSPNAGGYWREHVIELKEAGGLRVWSRGHEVVDDLGFHVVARTIRITGDFRARVIAGLSPRDAESLGRALIDSARLLAELDAADEGVTLLDAAEDQGR